MTKRAKINSFEFDNVRFKTKNKNKSTRTFDGSIVPRTKISEKVANFLITESDADTIAKLKEFLSNETFSIINFSSETTDENLNGLYAIESGSNKQKGGKTYQDFDIKTQGKLSYYHWLIGSQSIDSDFDTITDENFDQSANNHNWGEGTTHTGTGVTDAGYWWYAVIGDYQIHSASDFIECDVDNGTNHVVYYGSSTLPGFYALSDVTVQGEVLLTSNGYEAGLSLRNDLSNGTTYGYGYGFTWESGTNKIYFNRYEGNSYTLLQTWYNDADIDYNTELTMRVICKRDYFECYCDDSSGDLQLLDPPVYDTTYELGYYGFVTDSTAMNADDFSMEYINQEIIHLPVGAYNVNQIRSDDTSVHHADILSDGFSRTLNYPVNPVTFYQYKNTLNDNYIIADLPLNEGMDTTVYDSSGNDNHGTLSGSIWKNIYINGHNQKYLKFDGVNDYSQHSYDESMDIQQNVSVECYVRFNTLESGRQKIIYKGNNTLDRVTFSVGKYEWSATVEWYFTVAAGTARRETSDTTLTTDTWYHIICTYDGATQSIYLNGGLDASQSVTGIQDTITADMWLGRHQGGGDYFDGDLLFAKVYNKCLTASEVTDKYNQLKFNYADSADVKIYDTRGYDGDWKSLFFHATFGENYGSHIYDHSRNNNTITENSWSSSDWADGYNKWSKSYTFDHANDYFTLGTNPSLNEDLTLIAWIYRSAASDDHIIIDARDADNDGILFKVNSSDELELQYNTVDTTSTSTLSSGYWYFVAAVIDKLGDSVQLYINGSADGSAGDISGQTISVGTSLRVGANSFAAADYMNGYLSDIIIYELVLSATRIATLYETMPVVVDESDWYRVYDMDHYFVGDMVIDNGAIRVFQEYKELDSSTRRVWIVPYDSNWYNEDNLLGIRYFEAAAFDAAEPLEIKTLEKHKVVLQQLVEDTSTNEWVQHEIIITQGNPYIQIKIMKWALDDSLGLHGITKAGELGAACGYDQSPRLCLISNDTCMDAEVDSGDTSGGELEGISLAFSPQNNFLYMFWDTDGTTWQCNNAATSTPVQYIQNTNSVDFDLDQYTTNHYWGLGFMPFDTSILYKLGSAANWSAEDGTNTIWANLGATVYSTGTQVTIAIVGFPKGSYRVFYLLSGQNADEDGTIDCTGADINGSRDFTNQIAAGDWSNWYDFVAAENDTITFRFQRTGGTGELNCGEIVIFPICNNKNFSLDIKNQALNIMNINETGG